MGRLNLEDVLTRLNTYLSYLSADNQAKFINELPTYETFWDKLETGDLTENKCKIISHFIESDSEFIERSQKLVIDVARKLDQAGWTTLLTTGSEPLPTILLATDFETESTKFGEPLLQALQAAFEATLSNDSADSEALAGWFRLSKALDENRYKILLKDIKDKIVSGNQNPGMLAVLLAGGTELLSAGDFKTRSDDAVRHVILPLIEKSSESADWIKKNKAEIAGWTSKADRTTKEYLKDKILTLSDTEVGEVVLDIGKAIGVSIPKKRKEASEKPDEKNGPSSEPS